MKQGYGAHQLFSVFLLVVPFTANAGFFDTDSCEKHRDSLKVGEKLGIEVSKKDLRNGLSSDGVEFNFFETKISIGQAAYAHNWEYHDRMIIKGEQVKWIAGEYGEKKWLRAAFVGRPTDNFFATVVKLDGTDPDRCTVEASFDSFDKETENKIIAAKAAGDENDKNNQRIVGQKEQCRSDFDAIPEESGSLSKLDELATRCTNYVSTMLVYCNRFGGDGCREVNAKEVSAKWERIFLLRQKQLLAGTQQVKDFRDATLLHQPEVLEPIIASPLLTPDRKIYGNKLYLITIDAQEKDNLLRGKVSVDDGSFYVYLRTNAKSTIFHQDKLRIGAKINLIGRYVNK
jgi:hypothetical protein